MIDKKTKDVDLAQSAKALKRAAERAKQTSERTHTPFVVYKRTTRSVPSKLTTAPDGR